MKNNIDNNKSNKKQRSNRQCNIDNITNGIASNRVKSYRWQTARWSLVARRMHCMHNAILFYQFCLSVCLSSAGTESKRMEYRHTF